MSASGRSTKAARTARARKFVEGAQKHLAGTAVLSFASQDHTLPEVLGGLGQLVGLREAVEAAKADLDNALRAEDKQAPALSAWMDAFEDYVMARYSGSIDVLADFGLEPPKDPAPLTTDQQAVANAKRQATRKARGTMGKRQRLRIKGDVVDVVTTPVRTGKPGT